MSVTCEGKTADYEIPAGTLSLLAREAVELLARSTNLR
jgi:hypothetical protein